MREPVEPVVETRAVVATLAVLALLFGFFLARQEIARHLRGDPYEPLRNYPRSIPKFEARDLHGHPYPAQRLRGKTVVFVFCTLSRHSLALVDRAVQVIEATPTRKAVVLAVIQSRCLPQQAAARLPKSGQCIGLLDADHHVADRFGITRFPAVVMAGPNRTMTEALLRPRTTDLDAWWAERVRGVAQRKNLIYLRMQGDSKLSLKKRCFRCVGGVRDVRAAPNGMVVETFLGDTLLLEPGGALRALGRAAERAGAGHPREDADDAPALAELRKPLNDTEVLNVRAAGGRVFHLITGVSKTPSGRLILADGGGKVHWQGEVPPGKPRAVAIPSASHLTQDDIGVATPSGFAGILSLPGSPAATRRAPRRR